MKRILEILTQAVALSAVILGTVYVFSIVIDRFPIIWQALNSQFFIALLTLIVGFVAYFIYLKQKSDHKKDIAGLILQEIRYAEQLIRIARQRDHVYKLTDKLLPTNSWHSNIYLFIAALEESGTDTISRFYSQAEFLDYLIRKIADEKISNRPSVAPLMIQSTQFPGNPPTTPQIQPAQIQIDLSQGAATAEAILRDVSNEVELIYNSPAVEILRKISKD